MDRPCISFMSGEKLSLWRKGHMLQSLVCMLERSRETMGSCYSMQVQEVFLEEGNGFEGLIELKALCQALGRGKAAVQPRERP